MNNNDNGGKRKSKKKSVLRNTNTNANKSLGVDIIKPQIFLDIDQTLIAAVRMDNLDDDDDDDDEDFYDFRKYKNKAREFSFENMDDYYVIFERPHLQTFLDFLFENFNVNIWTAASKDYALFIIEHIIKAGRPERKLGYTFFSYHCSLSSKLKNGTKDLSMLWDVYKDPKYNKYNTFILDDYDEVYETQPKNCIEIEPFFFTKKGSERDDILSEHKMVKYLKKVKDKINKGDENFLGPTFAQFLKEERRHTSASSK
jgi:TFIIF-interacting CTD phosphatase-like protein